MQKPAAILLGALAILAEDLREDAYCFDALFESGKKLLGKK
jgi:hypothetical protein